MKKHYNTLNVILTHVSMRLYTFISNLGYTPLFTPVLVRRTILLLSICLGFIINGNSQSVNTDIGAPKSTAAVKGQADFHAVMTSSENRVSEKSANAESGRKEELQKISAIPLTEKPEQSTSASDQPPIIGGKARAKNNAQPIAAPAPDNIPSNK